MESFMSEKADDAAFHPEARQIIIFNEEAHNEKLDEYMKTGVSSQWAQKEIKFEVFKKCIREI